jgi:hypothetical protein
MGFFIESDRNLELDHVFIKEEVNFMGENLFQIHDGSFYGKMLD